MAVLRAEHVPMAFRPEVTREIQQCGADGAGGADDEDRCARRQFAEAGEHLERGEVGERDAHRLGRVDTVGYGHKELARGGSPTGCSRRLTHRLGHQLARLLGQVTPLPILSTTPTRS